MKINNTLDKLLQNNKRPLLMAHFIAGYPTVAGSFNIAKSLVNGGADILELQIPFSDPLADGPTIMAASTEALAHGVKVKDAFSVAKKLSGAVPVPIIIMSYANPVFRYGIAKFVKEAKAAGVSGLIIPDLPIDSAEGTTLLNEAKKCNVHVIQVISPGVSPARLKTLAPHASGFVYCTSRQGITGADSKFASRLAQYMQVARKTFQLPIGLGFGVRTHADFVSAAKVADIVIAGSVFVDEIKRHGAKRLPMVVKSLIGQT